MMELELVTSQSFILNQLWISVMSPFDAKDASLRKSRAILTCGYKISVYNAVRNCTDLGRRQ